MLLPEQPRGPQALALFQIVSPERPIYRLDRRLTAMGADVVGQAAACHANAGDPRIAQSTDTLDNAMGRAAGSDEGLHRPPPTSTDLHRPPPTSTDLSVAYSRPGKKTPPVIAEIHACICPPTPCYFCPQTEPVTKGSNTNDQLSRVDGLIRPGRRIDTPGSTQ